jgi:hypothetical protein
VTEFGPSADQAAALRLPSTVSKTTRKQIVEQTLQGETRYTHQKRLEESADDRLAGLAI